MAVGAGSLSRPAPSAVARCGQLNLPGTDVCDLCVCAESSFDVFILSHVFFSDFDLFTRCCGVFLALQCLMCCGGLKLPPHPTSIARRLAPRCFAVNSLGEWMLPFKSDTWAISAPKTI